MDCALVSVAFWIAVATIGFSFGVSVWVWVRHRLFLRWATASVQHAVDVFSGKVERQDLQC